MRAPERLELADSTFRDDGIVTCDPAMRELYAQAARAARASIGILLLGETGVGKEVLARAIHANSPRRAKPFMAINCAALAPSLLESELFGHEVGAFTGASVARPGLFEATQGGTVFLDEVGELPLAAQAKLLRVLEERTVTRLGATRGRPIDVRFVAATNRAIDAESRTETFRADLYFRLAGITFTIPPLRARSAEVDLLSRRFLSRACRELGRDVPMISPCAAAILESYAWPGNIRELRNVIERAAIMCPGETIGPEHLPPPLTGAVAHSAAPSPEPASAAIENQSTARPPHGSGLADDIRALERTRILEALARCGGNQSWVAEVLGISRRTLVSRLSAFGVPRPRRRPMRAGDRAATRPP